MARITFLTFYDEICIGPRQLSSILKQAGHKVNLIIFKGEKYDEIISEERKDLKCYSYYREGIFRGSLFDIDPWTEADENNLIELLKELSPDILAISTRSFWAELGSKLSLKIRENLPQLLIVAGGWGPSLEPIKFLKYCDYVFFGEGDKVILDIANAFDKGKDLRGVKNVVYCDGEKLVRNSAYIQMIDLDSLPFPDFDVDGKYLITEGKVQIGKEFYNNKIYDVFVGRGCPLFCSYCMSSKWQMLYKNEYNVKFKKQTWRSVNRVLEEIEKAKKNGAEFIRIKDEVFPTSKEWIEEFIPKYKDRIGLPFSGYLRPEFHDRDTIFRLYEAGLRSTMLGIQSGSDYIRRKVYRRFLEREKIIEFAIVLGEFEINTEYHLIGFCPLEKEEHMKETLEFLYDLPYAPIKIFKLKLFPKAPLTEMIKGETQDEVKDKLDAWYARLYTMAVKSEGWRELAKSIHKHNMFKNNPAVMDSLFYPELEKERQRLETQRKLFKKPSFSITEQVLAIHRQDMPNI